jgi:hypothetical protein
MTSLVTGPLMSERVRPSVDRDISVPPYGGAVLPELDGDKTIAFMADRLFA